MNKNGLDPLIALYSSIDKKASSARGQPENNGDTDNDKLFTDSIILNRT